MALLLRKGCPGNISRHRNYVALYFRRFYQINFVTNHFQVVVTVPFTKFPRGDTVDRMASPSPESSTGVELHDVAAFYKLSANFDKDVLFEGPLAFQRPAAFLGAATFHEPVSFDGPVTFWELATFGGPATFRGPASFHESAIFHGPVIFDGPVMFIKRVVFSDSVLVERMATFKRHAQFDVTPPSTSGMLFRGSAVFEGQLIFRKG